MTTTESRAGHGVPTDAVHQTIGLRPGVQVALVDGDYQLHHPWGRHQLRGLTEPDAHRLSALAEQPVPDTELTDERLRNLLLSIANLVTVGLVDAQGTELATLVPINRRAAVLRPTPVDQDHAVLSRFAYLRRLPETGRMVLESPLSAHRLTLHDPRVAAFVSALCGRSTASDAAERAGLPPRLAQLVVTVLGAAGYLDLDPDRNLDRNDALPLWDFHDLLFHSRSRYGLHDYRAGGLFDHDDLEHAAAIQQPEDPATAIHLPVPDWERIRATDPGLTEVVERRRSVRRYQSDPITVDQLGELMFRTARVRGLGHAGGDHPYASVDRPYPMGGGLGELEVYLAVHRCAGLEPGIYRYDSAGHRLFLRNADIRARERLYQQAWLATGGQLVDPQIQLCVTSRLARVQWKYSAIAYSVTLKHVGVLFAHLYLIATAMGLSPCGNGSGDTNLISRAIGVDWTTEPPVGEFLIGGPPAGSAPAPGAYRDIVQQSRSRAGDG